jgi:DNA-binding NarL/FixJ family response regulator
MNAATADQLAPEKVALVVGGEAAARQSTVRLLHAAGFSVSDGELLAGQSADADVIVLLGRADNGTHVRQIRDLAQAHPDARILPVMDSDASNAAMRRALLAGAAGIVLESELDRALVASVRAVAAGQLVVPVVLGRHIAPRPLSYREKEIVGLVVLGKTNREIAHQLYLAESTVKTHLSSAFRKLDARSRSEAVARIQDPEAGYGLGILTIAEPTAI